MRRHRHTRFSGSRSGLVGSATLLLVGGGLAAGATFGVTPAGAEPCLDVAFTSTRLIDWDGYNPKVEYSPAVPAALAPGTYDLTGSSFDDYPSRTGVTQRSEVWELQFLDASGAVIGTSGLTGDLPDRVARGEWAGSLGTVTLTSPAVAVRAHHRPDAHADGSANSVVPAGATVCPTVTTTTTTTTTAPPTSTSTTAAPTSTTSPSSTIAPSTTSPPSSAPPSTAPVRQATTVPVRVLSETTVVGDAAAPSPTTSTVPTSTRDAELASTGSTTSLLGGTGLILFGLGILLLGHRAQAALRNE